MSDKISEPKYPAAYYLWRLETIIPLFEEARDALPALTLVQIKLHDLSPTLADRMDEAGTATYEDWLKTLE